MTEADPASIGTAQLGRPVGANGAETRRRIITAAMRCVAEKGYSHASIRAIALQAQMTSGSLYHYFPNKSELLKATVEDIEGIALPRLRAAGQDGAHVIDRLEALLDESDRLMREYPYLATFERAIRAESAGYLRRGDPDQVGFQALRDIIANIIDDALRSGELAAHVDPAGTVDAIYALTRGLTEHATNRPADAYRARIAVGQTLNPWHIVQPADQTCSWTTTLRSCSYVLPQPVTWIRFHRPRHLRRAHNRSTSSPSCGGPRLFGGTTRRSARVASTTADSG